ncbi:hypothetical protein NIES970_16580 [[Synechococcus] sp. NIES-970]|uniref:hypothetical protein n=1 Tax=Picosynechococcus sp. NKBG15041c TaxID=1407650 RepID=UPI0004653C4C|nr:hypothetical protein [Picosynechococcus sp. NKBG15041c]BAW96719.1 hypothetical protein NIES970_16580 [[Synechococcus] sp. NIES-970]
MTSAVATPLDVSAIRYCAITAEHPFDTNFAPAQANSDWVKLVETEDDEYALLLCSYSQEEWVVWLPSQGETILHQEKMCRLA